MRFFRLLRFAVLPLIALGVAPGFLRAAPPVPAGTTSGSGLWTELAEKPVLAARGNVSVDAARRGVVPSAYRTLKLDRAVLNGLLAAAPAEFSRQAARAAGTPAALVPPVTEIELPMPDSATGFERFAVENSPIMEAGLAARYPEIRTFTLQGIDHPENVGRMDVTPAGLHAMILSPDGQIFVDPYFADGSDPTVAIAYRKADYYAARPFACLVPGAVGPPSEDVLARVAPITTGTALRVYRLALAATGEYTAVVSGSTPGTVAKALAAMVTTVNRVTGVYEREFAIRLTLVNNTNLLIYTNAATDPYTNDDGSTMLGQNQTNVDAIIGSANYDIGHVFSTGGGGIAGLGVVCRAGQKAQGVTGSPSPTGDPFDIDYVAHEMGHQFGGNHTFNSTTNACGGGNRNATTAYEPGSGTTIMAYAGICSTSGNVQDLAANSDAYFHSVSYDEIVAYTTTGAGRFPFSTTATNNGPPTLATLTAYTIPKGTPFALTAAGSDPNGDALTYGWEEYDRGGAVNATTTAGLDNGASPLFRSYSATTSPTRLFPSLKYILNNANVPPLRDPITGKLVGEALPAVARAAGLTFRCTVRDNRAGGGGSNWGDVVLTLATGAGPFALTSPNTAGASFYGGSAMTVTWNVAATTASPVACANVKISLSTDGGNTFPTVLAASVPNNGAASVTPPNTLNTSQARLKVEAVGNIFFDINDANFTIVQPTTPAFTSGNAPTGATVGVPFSFTFAASGPPAPTFSSTGAALPPGLTLNGTTGALTGTPTTPGVYNGLQVTASNGATTTVTQSFSLTVVNTFANYAAQNNLTGANALPGANPSGDGLTNLLKYGLNLPVNVPGVAPAGVVQDYSGTKFLSLRFTRVPLATDITYIVEVSPDLATWTTVASSSAGAVLTGPGVVSDAGGSAPLTVEVRDTVAQDPAVAGQRRFMRVRVTRP